MNGIYISLGSNLDNKLEHLQQAKIAISQYIGPIKKKSKIIETIAFPKETDPSFLNQVIFVETLLNTWDCMLQILCIERKIGRIRTVKNAPRKIDIDILLFNDSIEQFPLITIPHPFLHLRKFVLEPLAEIAPDLIIPTFNTSVTQILKNL